MAIEIWILGGVQARSDDVHVPDIRGVHGRSVLAALALSRGFVSVDGLVDIVWGDDLPTDPVSNLRSVISRLRSQLGKEAIVSGAAGYRFGDEVRTDVSGVADYLEIDGGLATDTSEELRRLGRVLSTWPAQSLADCADSSWFAGQRQRLAEVRSVVQQRRWGLLQSLGRLGEAVPELALAAHDEPETEAVHIFLMRALHASGRMPEAARAAAAFRRVLAESTGFDPSADFAHAEAEIFRPAEPSDGNPSSQFEVKRTVPSWPTDRFVGRLADVDRIASAVGEHQLVSIVGPGGVGKTRLAVETSRRWRSVEVCWVRLADEERESGVASIVGQALGLTDLGPRPADTISNRLSMAPTILIVDNAEHLWSSVRSLVERLLPRLGESRVVVTSRKPLSVSGEKVVRVNTLSLESSQTEHARPPAVELLIARLQELDVDAPWDEVSEDAAHDICRIVDGLPLAIELAAARVATLGPALVRDQLRGGSMILAVRDLEAARHGSLGALVDWSVRLVNDDIEHSFALLSVFTGWFDGAAAAAVAGDTVDVFEALHELSSGSLLDARVVRDAVRYRMLQPVRGVAARRLAELGAPAVDSARSRHAEWVIGRSREMCDTFLGPYDPKHPDRAQRELDELESDVASALVYLREHGRAPDADEVALRLSPLLIEHTRLRLSTAIAATSPDTPAGHVAIAVSMLERAAPEDLTRQITQARSMLSPDDEFAHTMTLYGEMLFAFYKSDFATVRRVVRDLIANPSTTDRHRSLALNTLGFSLRFEGDADGARRCVDDPRITHPIGGHVDYVRSSIVAEADPEEAIRLLERARRQAAAEHVTFQARLADVELLWQLHVAGRTAECFQHARRLIPRLMTGGYELQVWTALRILMLDIADEHPHAAARLLATVRSNPAIARRPARAAVAEAELVDRLASMISDDAARPGVERGVLSLWHLIEPLIAVDPAHTAPSER